MKKYRTNYCKAIINALIIIWLMIVCFRAGFNTAVDMIGARVVSCAKTKKGFTCKIENGAVR